MKKMLTLMAFAAMTTAFAQKVDLDSEKFTYTYRDYPTDPLPADYVTYSVTYNASGSTKNEISAPEVVDNLILEGFKKLESKAHLQVMIQFNSLIFNASQVKERFEIHKDKNGKETGRTYYYWVELSYSITGSAQMKDYKGNILDKSHLGGTYSYKTSEYHSYKEASDYFNNNRNALRGNFVRERVHQAVSGLSQAWSDKYGFPVRTGKDELWILDSKAHPEYDGHKKALKTVQEWMKTMSPNQPVTEIKEKLKITIDYFESLKTKYTKDEKRDRKMRYASWFNLGKIYLYLDDMDAAIKEAEGLIKNDHDPKDGKRMIEEAQRVKAIFNKNKANTRHFPIELDKMEGPK
ncbi:MAG: hypothetical protein RIS64_477 [Bacteroidota bacterium]|jgi:hypothetical protein